jgi:hypothetical protein
MGGDPLRETGTEAGGLKEKVLEVADEGAGWGWKCQDALRGGGFEIGVIPKAARTE